MDKYDKYYLMLVVMFIASIAGFFVFPAEQMWYPFSHFIICFIGIMAVFIAKITDKS